MIFFIPWVILLLVVILAVPIAAWLEKRNSPSAASDAMMEDEYGEMGEEDHAAAFDEEAGEPVAEAEAGEAVFEEAGDFGGGDLGNADFGGGGDDDAFADFK